ncbi:protein REBELOTE isoform X2 [Andrographis paniculata]|uniref:protein REBELOTE isoform X2 n=1 Tax=Andrographis paniculata TaxID=175694 RepID=UPI0021E8EA96|nr:protein REBELOTE isoform X2 [Andrographis paniculata]
MGKLGKKARKFAKKQLPSVLRRQRKNKAVFKKRASRGGKNDIEEEHMDNPTSQFNGSFTEFEGIENVSLGSIFTENDKDEIADTSDSDGYLSEDPSCPCATGSETDNTFGGESFTNEYSDLNKKIHADLVIQTKKLDKLRKKDPDFSKFLESYNNSAENFQDEDEYSDEDNLSGQGEQGDDGVAKEKKPLTTGIINTWCNMVREDHSRPALISLLNAYRAACHYGADSIGHRIENREAFCNIMFFTLSNADDAFRGQLQISSLNCTKEMLPELKKNSKWKELKPLVKSYVRSTLFLLNQVTDTDILAFAMTRLRASLIFFAAFPAVTQRLIKATVHLWATGEGTLSSASYRVIRDIASIFGSSYFDTCLSNTLAAFISRSSVTEIADTQHLQFLRDCTLDLCSLNLQKSSLKAVASITQLAKILSWGLQTKKKEALTKICNWEFVNCIDLWVMFVSANISDYDDLQSLVFMMIKLINGVAYMFPGPRYFPLRLKCIQWLNRLSGASGKFIPLASLVLDILEYKYAKDGRKVQNKFNVASVLKLPKQYLKSRSFQDECFHSAAEQFSFHFAQWSYHISFPDLATIPLLHLRKIHEATTVEILRRMLKRLIDQVEQNVKFVQERRDEVSFSPHDQQSADSFLQLEKSSLNKPFTQYYRSVLERAAERNLNKCGNTSSQEHKILKRKKAKAEGEKVAVDQSDAKEDRPTNAEMKPQKRRKKESNTIGKIMALQVK